MTSFKSTSAEKGKWVTRITNPDSCYDERTRESNVIETGKRLKELNYILNNEEKQK